MNYRLNTTEREARVDVVSATGERVGYVVADVYTPNQIWGRGFCASDVTTLLDRYPSAPRVLIVRASYLDYGTRSAGVGTRMYDALVRGAGKHFHGPVLVVPDGCWDGSTSEAAQRVWSKLRKTWDSAGNVIAAVPVVPEADEPTYSYKGNPEAIAFLLDARNEGLPTKRKTSTFKLTPKLRAKIDHAVAAVREDVRLAHKKHKPTIRGVEVALEDWGVDVGVRDLFSTWHPSESDGYEGDGPLRYRGDKVYGLKGLGVGVSRIVFALDAQHVLKIGVDSWGWAGNGSETKVWAAASPGLRKYLAPVVTVAPDSTWSIMRRAKPLDEEDFDEETRDALLNEMGEAGLEIYDPDDAIRIEQWGSIDGRPVFVDYGGASVVKVVKETEDEDEDEDEGLLDSREVHERAALKPGRTVGLLLGGTDNYRRVLLFDASALKRGEEPNETVLGEITMKSLKRGACRSADDVPAFTIATSVAKQGWGPALYDTAISVATHEGFAGVIPDRNAVSHQARKLWAFYANQRPDVGREAATGCALWGDDELDSIYMPRRQKGLVNISGMLERGRDAIRAAARARRCSQLDVEVDLFDEAGHWFGREYSNAMVAMNRRPKGRERRAALPLAAEVEGAGLVLEGVPG
jgi:hypothetical protein